MNPQLRDSYETRGNQAGIFIDWTRCVKIDFQQYVAAFVETTDACVAVYFIGPCSARLCILYVPSPLCSPVCIYYSTVEYYIYTPPDEHRVRDPP